MVTTDKDIKIRNAKGKSESEVCLEYIFYFLGSKKRGRLLLRSTPQ